MADLKVTDKALLDAYKRHAGRSKMIAQDVGLSVRRTTTRLRNLGVPPLTSLAGGAPRPDHEAPETPANPIRAAFNMPELPDETAPVEELIAHRKKVSARAIAAFKARELVQVPVRMKGPIVLALVGDPHVDDNGCDWDRLDADLDLIRTTTGMFAVHVGDITNNWSGRMMHLWAQQSTGAAEALKLAEYVLTRVEPLIVVTGNHDAWPGPLQGIIQRTMRGRPGIVGDAGVRVEFAFPNGTALRMHVRHDFPGRSMYGTTHGMKRELREGYRDHLLVAGHLHCDEVSVVPVETEGLVSTMVRVSGYKIADHYAAERRFVSKRMGPTAYALIDPEARLPAEIVKMYWDGDEVADILAYKRRRAAK